MAVPPGRVEIMVSFAGGELLECQETRGLTLLCASVFDQPAAEALAAIDPRLQLDGRDVRIEGGVMSDSFMIRIGGAAADVPLGLEVAAAILCRPVVTPELLEAARTAACSNVEKTQSDTRWAVTEPLLELVTPINECRNKLACTKRMSGYTPEQVQGWITRHASTAPCEIALVGDIELNPALELAARVMGVFPSRAPAAPGALAEQRCVAPQQGPFAKDVGCKGNANVQEAHVLAGFLSPDPSQILEVRRLRAGARVLSERLENRLRELKLGGDPHVSWTYMPSPFAGRSVTVVSARVSPGDAEPVKQVMQASMCELIDHGLPADELARSTDMLARVAAAYERDPRYWASILSRSGIGGLDPDQIADSAEVYRSMKPDEVLAAMRRACTIENRLDLVVRPAP
jgi:predicted Zn-dependent peptidase